MKFLHAADIHLDSPLRGLRRYDGAPVEQILSATRRAFINLIDFACSEAVDFVLLAGDLYDVDWKDYNTGLFFNQQMSRLREAEIPVFLVLGNHDAGNRITKQLRLPDNVTEFSQEQPETKILEHLGVAIHGQSFATQSVTEDISATYPNAISGYFNIGLLHTSLNGRPGHANYAPCTMPSLLSHGYDYWALGHVHKHEILHEQPWVVFSGNLQGRHARETGSKGCVLVNIDKGQTSVSQIPVDVFRWEICKLNLSQITQAEDLLIEVRELVTEKLKQADGRTLALRFILEGATSIHNELHSYSERWINEIRATATDVGLGNIWVEKIKLQTRPLNAKTEADEGALDVLKEFLETLPKETKGLQALSKEFRSLINALPPEARLDDKANYIDPSNPESIRNFLNNGVEELLMARMQM